MRSACLAPLLAAASAILPGAAIGAESSPAEVVRQFNAALTARKLGDAVPLLAEGGVQYTLRPAHAGMTTSPKNITTDLRAHWSQVGSLLFTVTTHYARVPTVVDEEIHGDIATVWTRIATEVTETRSKATHAEQFDEVYLLVQRDSVWKIAAIADARRTDDIDVSE